jgi:hypothetical protein
VWYNIHSSITPKEGVMNRTIVLVAVLSMLLGGCVTTGVRTSATIYTAPAHTHHHGVGSKTAVSTTTTVETERRAGEVVKKTTIVVRKGKGVDCSDRNPYRDELTPSSPCYWKRQMGSRTWESAIEVTSTQHLPPNYVRYKVVGEYQWYRHRSRSDAWYIIHRRHW